MMKKTKQIVALAAASVAAIGIGVGVGVLGTPTENARVDSPFKGVYSGRMIAFADEASPTSTAYTPELKGFLSDDKKHLLLISSVDDATQYQSTGFTYQKGNETQQNQTDNKVYKKLTVKTSDTERKTYTVTEIFSDLTGANAAIDVIEIDYDPCYRYNVSSWLSADADGTDKQERSQVANATKALNTTNAETDVKTGYTFTAPAGKTISTVALNGENVSTTDGKITFENTDPQLKANADPVNNNDYMAVRTYTVQYDDGCYDEVNVTLWSLLIGTEADMREMKDYVVSTPTKIHTGKPSDNEATKKYVGYFKVTQNISWSNIYWNAAAAIGGELPGTGTANHTYACVGFHGVFDGNGKTISSFYPNGNRSGLFNVLGTDGVVKNVTFENVKYHSGNYSRGVVAAFANGGTIKGVTINGLMMTFSSYDFSKDNPCGILVGSVGSNSTENGNYTLWCTGLKVQGVTINVVNGNFGTEITATNFTALGGSNYQEGITYTSKKQQQIVCENVTVSGCANLFSYNKNTDVKTTLAGVNETPTAND